MTRAQKCAPPSTVSAYLLLGQSGGVLLMLYVVALAASGQTLPTLRPDVVGISATIVEIVGATVLLVLGVRFTRWVIAVVVRQLRAIGRTWAPPAARSATKRVDDRSSTSADGLIAVAAAGPAALAAARLTAVAAFLAGKRRASSCEAWRAHLGELKTGSERLRAARGFMVASLLLRWDDGCALFWTLVDWVLTTDGRVATVVAAVAVDLMASAFYRDGMDGVLSNGENIVALSAATWGAALGLRRLRGIEVLPSTPRRKNRDPLARAGENGEPPTPD